MSQPFPYLIMGFLLLQLGGLREAGALGESIQTSIHFREIVVPSSSGLSRERVLWAFKGDLYYPSTVFPNLTAYNANDQARREVPVRWKGAPPSNLANWDIGHYSVRERPPLNLKHLVLNQSTNDSPFAVLFDFSNGSATTAEAISVNSTPGFFRLRHLDSNETHLTNDFVVFGLVDFSNSHIGLEHMLQLRKLLGTSAMWMRFSDGKTGHLDLAVERMLGISSESVYRITDSGLTRYHISSGQADVIIPMATLRRELGPSFGDPNSYGHLPVLEDAAGPAVFILPDREPSMPEPRSAILRGGKLIPLNDRGSLLPLAYVGQELVILRSKDPGSLNSESLRDGNGIIHWRLRRDAPNRFLAAEWDSLSRTAIIYVTPKPAKTPAQSSPAVP